jgi:LmbE family N-acetylglucosaminyl deacetylase
MVIGAHPDDGDFRAGGCAALWTAAGMAVRFVSVTNGDAGHHELGGGPLALRRAAEAAAAGARAGIDYQVLDLHDGELVPSLDNRKRLIAEIRAFEPDLLLTHRPNDYHADHRYTSQLVQDASFLLTVPNICPHAPALRDVPVIAYLEDGFQKPAPFVPDVVVDISAVMATKIAMMACHESQVYEWLPWLDGRSVPEGDEARLAWLGEWISSRGRHSADRFRAALVAAYGAERGGAAAAAEAFELCEYGAALNPERRRRLFPMLP